MRVSLGDLVEPLRADDAVFAGFLGDFGKKCWEFWIGGRLGRRHDIVQNAIKLLVALRQER
jgi:hypothetical protein